MQSKEGTIRAFRQVKEFVPFEASTFIHFTLWPFTQAKPFMEVNLRLATSFRARVEK